MTQGEEQLNVRKEGEFYIIEEKYLNRYTAEEIKLAYKNLLMRRDNLKQQIEVGVPTVKKQKEQLQMVLMAVDKIQDKLEGPVMQQIQQMIQQHNQFEQMLNPLVLDRQQTEFKKLSKALDEMRTLAGSILVEEKKEERKQKTVEEELPPEEDADVVEVEMDEGDDDNE